MIEIINGKVYEKLPEGHLEEEIARREAEIVRINDLLVTLQRELDEMKGKAVEKEIQLSAKEEVLLAEEKSV